MIQEKDFLYRVPVKTAPITTPRGQIRNPEILVDVEGGEFMHGNILDANSTNKLINQSVKEAIDNKIIEDGYVTKDLLEAETTRATEQENSLKTFIDVETSARTNGDEDLDSKIKAEQTRAEGKEKEISDKLAIVDGDSNTEGSFRKAIADIVAAAPEDLDTLKEIADKLAGNDDLHTALNQAITEKADASALANEVTRATGAESGLQAAIATKADATALSNYVLTTALNQQVDTLNAAISAKQDAGSYITYNPSDRSVYQIDKSLIIKYNDAVADDAQSITLNPEGISNTDNNANHVFATDGSIADLTQYALKTELPTVPTKTSQLTNDSNFIAAAAVDDDNYTLKRGLKICNEADGYSTIGKDSITVGNREESFGIDNIGIRGHGIHANCSYSIDGVNITNYSKTISIDPDQIVSSADEIISFLIEPNNITLGDINNPNVKISSEGIKFANKSDKEIPTADGTFIVVDDFASIDDVSDLHVGLSRKQDKITVNDVDITDIETADITKLRTIVINLINALNASDLIRQVKSLE